jgi:hypothetical protein
MTNRDRYLQRKYGITEAEYEVLLWHNDGCCWICGHPPKKQRLHVEHDHRTKSIRGLTCWRCNALLQHARDDPAILRKAADYLESVVTQDLIALERIRDA